MALLADGNSCGEAPFYFDKKSWRNKMTVVMITYKAKNLITTETAKAAKGL